MIKKICLLLLTLLITVSFSSCEILEPEERKFVLIEEGDYIYALSKPIQSEYSETYLYSLSKTGKQKKFLVYPKEFKGKKISNFGIVWFVFNGGFYRKDDFSSECLDKIFIDFEFKDCGRYNYPDNRDGNTYTFVLWYEYQFLSLYSLSPRIKEMVIGNNLVNKLNSLGKMNGNINHYIANVSYQYNYEDAPNDGYYWVDNYDNSLIEYIPPVPSREGYKFDGWYKEKECKIKWEFERDKTGDVYLHYDTPNISSSEEYIKEYEEYVSNHTYVETKLYAKWVKK